MRKSAIETYGLRSPRIVAILALLFSVVAVALAQELPIERIEGARPRNVVFILSDDHRYDAMGFLDHPFLETPHMDSIARSGVYLKNAFVTTSLCSPSRASILTGLYTSKHRVIDNNRQVPPGTIFFPRYLQQVGYETAFVGKWHMGRGSERSTAWIRLLGQLSWTGLLSSGAGRAQRQWQARSPQRLHHRRTHRLCSQLAQVPPG